MRLSLAMSLFAALTVSFTSCAFAQEKELLSILKHPLVISRLNLTKVLHQSA